MNNVERSPSLTNFWSVPHFLTLTHFISLEICTSYLFIYLFIGKNSAKLEEKRKREEEKRQQEEEQVGFPKSFCDLHI